MFTCECPLYAVVPLYKLKTFLLYTIVQRTTYPLSNNSYRVPRIGDDARTKTGDQHSGHRHKGLLLASCSSPYPPELIQEYRVLPDGNPGALNESCPYESRSHAGNLSLPRRLSGGVFTRDKSYKAGYLLGAGKARQVFSQFQDQPDGSDPSDAGTLFAISKAFLYRSFRLN